MDVEMTAKHSIKAAAKLAGISPFLIRAWERRYNAVIPERTATNRRLYSDQDIEKLILLHKATLKGESIGQVAGLSIEELKAFLGENSITETAFLNGTSDNALTEIEIINRCIELTANLDREGLYKILLEAEARFSKPVLLDDIIMPFLQKIGERWQEGSLKVVHEHLASAVIRSFLGELLISYKAPKEAPSIISSTLPGQHHEFGAIIAALAAISEGWKGVYLGPNLPAEEIASGAGQNRVKAIALSVVYPSDDPHLGNELRKLRRLVGDDIVILAGGRTAEYYRAALEDIDAIIVKNMAEFRKALRDARNAFSSNSQAPAK
jgi:DNA-binding transcriptional MerR regulator/methylmalonyl-CoA mutase cobalamin-binding subunit